MMAPIVWRPMLDDRHDQKQMPVHRRCQQSMSANQIQIMDLWPVFSSSVVAIFLTIGKHWKTLLSHKRSLYNPQITSFTFPLSSTFIQVRFSNCQKQPDYFYSCRKAILLISRYYVSWLLLHHSIGRASEDAGRHILYMLVNFWERIW